MDKWWWWVWDTRSSISAKTLVSAKSPDWCINNTQSAPGHIHTCLHCSKQWITTLRIILFCQNISVFCSVCPWYVRHTALFAGQLNYCLILLLLISSLIIWVARIVTRCGQPGRGCQREIWSIFGNWAHIIQSETYRMNVRHMMNLSPWITAHSVQTPDLKVQHHLFILRLWFSVSCQCQRVKLRPSWILLISASQFWVSRSSQLRN